MSHHGSDSFALRRPHATNLPNFELPPPPMNQKFGYPPHSQHQGHSLPTPPTTGAPAPTAASTQPPGQYTPQGYVWSPHSQNPPYGFQSAPQQNFSQSRSSALPPPPYELNLPPFPSSGPMSAPATLPTMPSQQQHQQQQHGMPMTSTTPVSSAPPHPSPVHAQEGFRPPPTPGYYSQQSATPQPQQFPFSSGPSPTQASPMSAGGVARMSPVTTGPMSAGPQQSPHTYQRPFGQYPLPGPVLSNVQNPNGGMQLVNGPLPHSMPLGFNSGHAAGIHHHLYQNPQHGHPAPQPQTTDRPFKCDQCPQSFNRNHDLKRHKRIHLAVKPFPCGHCEKSFSRKDALKRHILVKGCGKAAAAAAADKDKADGSASPDQALDGHVNGTDSKSH